MKGDFIMALIKCKECSAEISDEAKFCPNCGAPVILHRWRCPKCGNMISKEPCPYCSNELNAVNRNTISYENVSATESNVCPTTAPVSKKKRNPGVLFAFLLFATIAIIFFVVFTHNSDSNTKIPNPNRTQEECSLYGTAKVYPALHANGNCIPDGDAYWWHGFGHHHHK